MTDPSVTCCFTGHRPNRLPWLEDKTDLRTQAITRSLWQRIVSSYDQGYTCFLSGMALGVDLICAELVLKLADQEPEVKLIPVVPFPSQSARWSSADRMRYQKVLNQCREDLVVVCPSYRKDCYLLRNRYLVDHSSKIIGVYDGIDRGGTHQTLEYAKRRGLEMELLIPG